jgi:hypothetical protein
MATTTIEPVDLTTIKVLIIEDDPSIGKILVDALGSGPISG